MADRSSLDQQTQALLEGQEMAGERLVNRIRLADGLLGLAMLSVFSDINTPTSTKIFVLQGLLLVSLAVVLELFFRRSQPLPYLSWLKYLTITFDLVVVHLFFFAAQANHSGPIEYFQSFLPLVIVQFNLLAGLRYSVRACLWSTALTLILGGGVLAYVLVTGQPPTSSSSVWGQDLINVGDELMRLIFIASGGLLAAVLANIARRLLQQAAESTAERSRLEAQRARLAKYVGGELADTVINAKGELRLGGSRRQVTIVFIDIRNFTTLAHDTPPEQVVSLLNTYFTALVDVVFAYQGTLDKFLGDGLMAVWGAPLERDLASLRAVLAAIEMNLAVDRLNAKNVDGYQLRIGAGIATGEVIAGNVGSKERMEYTVIGESVNVAARLEALNRDLNSAIIINEQTRADIEPWLDCEPVPPATRLSGVLSGHRAYSLHPSTVSPARLAQLRAMVLSPSADRTADSTALP